MKNPIGLATFMSAIQSMHCTGSRAYRGTFDPTPRDADEFLPIGAPAIVVFGGTGVFTVTTDALGWVTSIKVELRVKETLKMTTTFSGHGKPVKISKPGNVGEAYDFSYD